MKFYCSFLIAEVRFFQIKKNLLEKVLELFSNQNELNHCTFNWSTVSQ